MKTENATNAFETGFAEKIAKNISWMSPEVIEEKFTVTSKPLDKQILTLTQLLNQLIQDNSAEATPTARSLTHRP